jgi:hypothetical protein
VALIDKLGSARVGRAGLRQSALKSATAIDLETPLIEVGEEDRKSKCEQAHHD